MLLCKNGSHVANIDENKISNKKTEKCLGLTFDKLHALARVASYMD